jgi:hypothetical protein
VIALLRYTRCLALSPNIREGVGGISRTAIPICRLECRKSSISATQSSDIHTITIKSTFTIHTTVTSISKANIIHLTTTRPQQHLPTTTPSNQPTKPPHQPLNQKKPCVSTPSPIRAAAPAPSAHHPSHQQALLYHTIYHTKSSHPPSQWLPAKTTSP